MNFDDDELWAKQQNAMTLGTPPFGAAGDPWRPKPASSTNGTGYAGDTSDKQIRAKARKEAHAKQRQTLQQQCQLLKNQVSSSANNKEPTDELLTLLRQVLRNLGVVSSPAESSMTGLALQIIETQILPHHPEALGNLYSGDDSLLLAMQEAAAKSKLIVQEQQVAPDLKKQAQKLLELFQQAKALGETPEIMVTDSQDNYRSALRPFAFGFVDQLKHHHFYKPTCTSSNTSRNHKRLFQELSNFQTNLPIEYGSSIFVRAMEGSMEYLRVLILGPSDTPYANGCFVFDLHLGDYPQKPPKCQFLTTGGGKYRFNPNLYQCGKVCLSLLGTWSGPGWQPNESTLYQLLISIQSLILGESEPYFNEPGFQTGRGTRHGQVESLKYNQRIRNYTCAAAILPFLQQPSPYPEFEAAIQLHFSLKQAQLYKQLQQWAAEHVPHPILPTRPPWARHTHTHDTINHIQLCLDQFQKRMTDYSDVQVVNSTTASPAKRRRTTKDKSKPTIARGAPSSSTRSSTNAAIEAGGAKENPLVICIDDDDDGVQQAIHASLTTIAAADTQKQDATNTTRDENDDNDEQDCKLPAASAAAVAQEQQDPEILEIDDDDDMPREQTIQASDETKMAAVNKQTDEGDTNAAVGSFHMLVAAAAVSPNDGNEVIILDDSSDED